MWRKRNPVRHLGASLAEAQATIGAAADYWENAFRNSVSSAAFATAGRVTQNINVGWSDLPGSTLAQGGTSFFSNGRFAQGTLSMDSSDSTFYVDTTPWNDAEWASQTNRTAARRRSTSSASGTPAPPRWSAITAIF